MDLATLCDIWHGGANGTSGCHLAVFSEDVAVARHFVATRLPRHPAGMLVVLTTPVKKLSKMVGYSDSSFNSWCIGRV